jgi:hypothetical protein
MSDGASMRALKPARYDISRGLRRRAAHPPTAVSVCMSGADLSCHNCNTASSDSVSSRLALFFHGAP